MVRKVGAGWPRWVSSLATAVLPVAVASCSHGGSRAVTANREAHPSRVRKQG